FCPHELDHLLQWRAGEENAIDALAMHDLRVGSTNRPPATTENTDVARLLLAQSANDFAKELDVPPVVAGEADRRDILLDGGTGDVGGGAVEAEVDHLDSAANQLHIDGGDGAVVPVAYRHGGENADGGPGHTRDDNQWRASCYWLIVGGMAGEPDFTGKVALV